MEDPDKISSAQGYSVLLLIIESGVSALHVFFMVFSLFHNHANKIEQQFPAIKYNDNTANNIDETQDMCIETVVAY